MRDYLSAYAAPPEGAKTPVDPSAATSGSMSMGCVVTPEPCTLCGDSPGVVCSHVSGIDLGASGSADSKVDFSVGSVRFIPSVVPADSPLATGWVAPKEGPEPPRGGRSST